jgi:hypothetical protein
MLDNVHSASAPNMRLVEVNLEVPERPIPAPVAELLADAEHRIDELEEVSRAAIPAFVPSDYRLVYGALATIMSANLATGRQFLEWGSGMGVIACLAETLGFDAAGIEIEPALVRIAEKIATKHNIDARFACGSFVPDGVEHRADLAGDVHWLSTSGADGYEELQLEIDDFDLIFAYPWPGEEQIIFDIFADRASVGTLLLTYHGQEGVRLQRKMRR